MCVLKCSQEFARRALGKINELAKLGEHSEVPATRETQRAYKDASIKARNLSLRYISTLCCCDKMLFLSVLDTAISILTCSQLNIVTSEEAYLPCQCFTVLMCSSLVNI